MIILVRHFHTSHKAPYLSSPPPSPRKFCITLFFHFSWTGLFKRWIALSTGQVTIQRISIRETNCAIQWIEIYPVDSLIHLLNNWELGITAVPKEIENNAYAIFFFFGGGGGEQIRCIMGDVEVEYQAPSGCPLHSVQFLP